MQGEADTVQRPPACPDQRSRPIVQTKEISDLDIVQIGREVSRAEMPILEFHADTPKLAVGRQNSV